MSKKASCKGCKGVEQSEVKSEEVDNLKRNLFHERKERVLGVHSVALAARLRVLETSLIADALLSCNGESGKEADLKFLLHASLDRLRRDLGQCQDATLKGRFYNLLAGETTTGF